MKKIILLFACLASLLYAKKIVVLEPSIVEILYALKAENNIVAISKMLHSNIWPKEKTQKLPHVGNYSKPNIEKIISLKPDLVIVNRYSSKAKEDLEKFGIKTTSFEANSLKDIYKNIKSVGTLVDKKQEAKKLVNTLQKRIASINTKNLQGKKAIFFYSSSPLMAFNSKSLPGDILKLLHLQNLSDDLKGDRPIISQEYILVKNPDFIIAMQGMANTSDILIANPLLKNTTAIKNNKMTYVSSSSYLRGSHKIVDEIEKLAKELQK